MPGKRFQGHWKDLLAERRQPANPGRDTKSAGKEPKGKSEASPPLPAAKTAKAKSEAVATAEGPPESPAPLTAEYQAKLRAAALIGFSQRPQTTGEVEPPSGILAEIAPVVQEETDEEPRFPRLRTAVRAFHRYRYVSLAVSLSTLFVCLMVVYGHDDGRPVRVSVSGQVRLDGKPLMRGLVVFVPAQGRASTGSLDEQGRYVLTCFDGRDGAMPGQFRVEIAPDGVPLEGEPAWLVPSRYSRCETSGLTADIPGATSDADFDLTSAGLKPPVNLPEGPPPRDGKRTLGAAR